MEESGWICGRDRTVEKKLKFGFFSFWVSFFILKIVLCCDQSVGQYGTFSSCFIVSSNKLWKLQIDYKTKNLLKIGILNLASTTRLLRTERQREREKDRRKNDTWFEKIETQNDRMAETERERRKTSLKSRMMRRGERNYTELFFESNSMKYIARGGRHRSDTFLWMLKILNFKWMKLQLFQLRKFSESNPSPLSLSLSFSMLTLSVCLSTYLYTSLFLQISFLVLTCNAWKQVTIEK